jgi:putative hemin transport protein
MEVPAPADVALAGSIRAYFEDDRSRMTMMAARKFDVPEQAVVEALVGHWPIVRLRDGAFGELMDALPDLGTMRVFVRSKAAIIESVGQVRRLFRDRPLLQRPDRHPRHAHLPRRDPRDLRRREVGARHQLATHSFQLFDHAGNAAFKAFLWENFPDVPRLGSRPSTPWHDASRNPEGRPGHP